MALDDFGRRVVLGCSMAMNMEPFWGARWHRTWSRNGTLEELEGGLEGSNLAPKCMKINAEMHVRMMASICW